MVRKGIIDFTAFLNKERKVIIKELSVIDVDSKCLQHWMFRPPQDQPYQTAESSWNNRFVDYRNTWLTTHYHGLYYSNGTTNYETLPSALDHICHDLQILFAPTNEKAKVLQNILKNERAVISLELFGCPTLPREPLCKEDEAVEGGGEVRKRHCLFHEIYAPGFYCTQSAVQMLAEWCSDNVDRLDMNNPENREKTFVGWKLSSPTPKQLAEHGFIRVSDTEDTTKCIYCNVTLHKWEENDDPAEDHAMYSPFCRLICYRAQERWEEERKKKKKEEQEEAKKKNNSDGDGDGLNEEGGRGGGGGEGGQDVCGSYEMPKLSKNDVFKLCYA